MSELISYQLNSSMNIDVTPYSRDTTGHLDLFSVYILR